MVLLIALYLSIHVSTYLPIYNVIFGRTFESLEKGCKNTSSQWMRGCWLCGTIVMKTVLEKLHVEFVTAYPAVRAHRSSCHPITTNVSTDSLLGASFHYSSLPPGTLAPAKLSHRHLLFWAFYPAIPLNWNHRSLSLTMPPLFHHYLLKFYLSFEVLLP